MTELAEDTQRKLEYDLWACGACSRDFPGVFKDRQAAKLIGEAKAGESIDAKTILAAIREKELVDKASDYLQSHPGAAIVDLGCGFRTYFALIDNGIVDWYNVDTPEVLAARKDRFEDDFRITQIAGDPLDPAWMDEIHFDRTEGLYLIASGLAETADAERLRTLVATAAERFGDAAIGFDLTADPFNEMAPQTLKLSSPGQAATAIANWSTKIADVNIVDSYPKYIKQEKELARKVRSQVKSAVKKGALIIAEAHFA